MKKNQSTHSSSNSRRKFIKHSVLGATAFSIIPSSVLGFNGTAANSRIQIGVIGLGKQIEGLSNGFLDKSDCQIIAGCDVWSTKRKWYQKFVQKKYAKAKGQDDFNGLKVYHQYKELLADKSIDAVIIATPDHWHGIQAVDAMKAGKDVYVEKPLSHTITEGIQMVDTAKAENRILQTGSMQRSWKNFRKACELVSNGYLGEIKEVLVNVGDPAVAYNLEKEDMPDEVDWNLWCGPAPLLDYNHRLSPKGSSAFWPDWRQFREVGGGILADWGAHMFDIAQWGLGMDHSGPISYEPPADKTAVRGMKMTYANGVVMKHEDFGRGWGVRFIGSEGSIDISRSFFETTPEKLLKVKDSEIKNPLYRVEKDHYRDFLDAVKNRTQPVCPPEVGHRSATICNAANIAYQLGRKLDWDPEKQSFVKDNEANFMKTRENRNY